MKPEEQAFIDNLEKLNMDELSNEFLEELWLIHESDGLIDEILNAMHIHHDRKNYPSDEELLKMVQPPVPNKYFPYDQHYDKMNPDGSLCGVNFIFDYDNDPRLLLACYMLKNKGVLCLHERKAELSIYTKKIIPELQNEQLDLPNDSWNCTQYIPTKKGWDSV